MSLSQFRLTYADLAFLGEGLARPESVLALRDGSLICSDARGVVSKIAADGKQELVGAPSPGSEPNGIALDREGNLYVANFGTGRFEKLTPQGDRTVLLDEIDGVKIRFANYVTVDPKGGLYLSVTTRCASYAETLTEKKADGYIVRVDDKGARVVADGIFFTNECRLDPSGKFLYVAETGGDRMTRYPVRSDASLGPVEAYGPHLGHGFMPDGFAFDAEGNIWVVALARASVVVLTPRGDVHNVLDVRGEHYAHFESQIKAGTFVLDEFFACAKTQLPLPTSIAFGGPDLKTVYLGSLANTRIATFRSPIAGHPMLHW